LAEIGNIATTKAELNKLILTGAIDAVGQPYCGHHPL
jgi:hypothetical protein